MKDDIPYSDRVTSVAFLVIGALGMLYLVTHQMGSTGFFTEKFGTLEVLILYGYLSQVIISGTLYGLLGRKHLALLFYVFGGLIIAVITNVWLYVVFPFEFTYFADVLPDFLRFLVHWISNDIARMLIVLNIIVHLLGEVYVAILYVYIRKARARKNI